MPRFLTATLYKFVELPDFAALQSPLLAMCEAQGVKGTLLLASEGINGTIAGPQVGVYAVLAWLRSDERLTVLEHKESWTDVQPFYRMKVRLKKEIVTMGVPEVHPALMAGQYVKPADWNALVSSPDVVLVDTRNDYEVKIGTFEGAINPDTHTFAELPGWVERQMHEGGRLASVNGKKPRVAMFCTGGIRCEKSTALLRSKGFEEVYHLEGGILKYLETVPQDQSTWQGECFLFDERVSVGHALEPGTLSLCRSCRNPVNSEEKKSPLFELGVSCPHCHDQTTATQKAGYRQRQKQVLLANSRLQGHIGVKQTHGHGVRPPVNKAGGCELPVLYSFRRCPYAMRARLAIAVSNVAVELREVVLKNKPAELLVASPKGTVPVLVLPDGQVIDQSLDVMLWALRQHDPDQWLQQKNTGGKDTAMANMLALIAVNDGPFKHSLDRYKYPHRFAAEYESSGAANFVHRHRSLGAVWLASLEPQLERGHLFGPLPSLADMALLVFVRQFARTDIAWFEVQPWPYLKAWLAAFEASSLFESVMQRHPPWLCVKVADC